MGSRSLALGYFGAMGLTLREGRFLSADDSRSRERVCVVDEDFARYYWPKTSALGPRVFQGAEPTSDAQAFTVVGVVGAVKQAGLTDEAGSGAIYYPYALRTDDTLFIVVRSSLPPESLARGLQDRVRSIDPELPVNDIRTMDARITDSLVAHRSPAVLAGLFSLIAVLITGIGTYGVMSNAVAQRRREIGVRIALGARPEQIRGHFLGLTLRLLAAGSILGVIGAWLSGQAMRTLLFHVPPLHLAAFGAALGIVSLVSLAPCLLSSYCAARVSPMAALSD
ncbi:MAG: FtsX-like permease family protein [Acidobacteriota bacterium]